METKTKLIWLELISGVFGWVWMLACVTALYFLVVAIFSDSPWSHFFWALGIGVVAEWLARGFRENQTRVDFVAKLMEKGLSHEKASKEWFDMEKKS